MRMIEGKPHYEPCSGCRRCMGEAREREDRLRAERDEAREEVTRLGDKYHDYYEVCEDRARLRAALRELREAAWDVYHRTTGARQDPEIKALRAAGEKADAALADEGADKQVRAGSKGHIAKYNYPPPHTASNNPAGNLADEGEE